MEIAGLTTTLPFDALAHSSPVRAVAVVPAIPGRVLAEQVLRVPDCVQTTSPAITGIDLKPIRSLHSIKEYQLANGLRIIMVPDAKETFRASLMIKAGSNQDPAERKGLNHLLEHFQTDIENYYIAEILGGKFYAGTGNKDTQYSMELSPQFQDIALGSLAKVFDFHEPTLQELKIEKHIVNNEIQDLGNDNNDVEFSYKGEQQMFAHLFPKNDPRRYHSLGIPKDIEATSVSDLKSSHSQHYVPDKAVLVLSGNSILENSSELLKQINNNFGKLKASPKTQSARLEPIAKWQNNDGKLIEIESAYQPGLELVFPLAPDSKNRERIYALFDMLVKALNSKQIEPELIENIRIIKNDCKDYFSIKVITKKHLDPKESQRIIDSIENLIKELKSSPSKSFRGIKEEAYKVKDLFEDPAGDNDFSRVKLIENAEYNNVPWNGILDVEDIFNERVLRETLDKYFKLERAKKFLFTASQVKASPCQAEVLPELDLNPEIKIPAALKSEAVSRLGDFSPIKALKCLDGPHRSKIYLVPSDRENIEIFIQPQITKKQVAVPLVLTELASKMLEAVGDSSPEVCSGLSGRLYINSNFPKGNFHQGLNEFRDFFLSNNIFNSSNDQSLKDKLEDLKKKLITEKLELQTPKARAEYLFLSEILPEGHPWRPLAIKELEESLAKITLIDIRDYLRRNLNIDDSSIFVKGDIDEMQCQKDLLPVLKSLQSNMPKIENAKISKDTNHGNKFIDSRSVDNLSESSSIKIGNTFNRENTDEESLDLLMPIIKDLVSRKLTRLLREQTGLIFHADIETYYNNANAYGYYDISTSTDSDPKLVTQLTQDFLERLTRDGFTTEEIAYAKLHFISEVRKGIAEKDLDYSHFMNRDPQTLSNQIKMISPDQVNELMRTVIKPKQLVTVVCA